MLKHLEDIRSPKNPQILKDPSPIYRNAQQSIHGSIPQSASHKRAKSDCETAAGKRVNAGVIAKATAVNEEAKAKAAIINSEKEADYKNNKESSGKLRQNRAISKPNVCNIEEKNKENDENSIQKRVEKIIEASTKGTTSHNDEAISPTYNNLKDETTSEREKLIQYNLRYMGKHKQIPPTTVDCYKFIKLIGKGAFGKVTLGVHKLTGKYVAIKTIEKSYMKDDFSRKKVFREVYILKKIRHANVIRLLEVFESSQHLLIVMEYAGGGDMLQYIKKHKRLSEIEAKPIFRQIVYGLGHIHSRSVLHRDIKLDNILLDGNGGVKICDFGVSKIIDKRVMLKEQCGTPAYIAPEIISDNV